VSLEGKVIVVVGAGGDIGSSVRAALLNQGVKAVGFEKHQCDVTSLESVRSALGGAWAAYERLDGLVLCNGAPGVIKPSLTLTDDEFQRVLEIDLVGSFRAAREAMRYMGPQGHGKIVFLSSMHAIATYPERAAYAAAKAGVCGMMRALAIEWAQRNVQVNAVLPGQVEGTERTEPHMRVGRAMERSPSGFFVYMRAVTDAVCYLLDSSGVNGHSLVVDDGWLASAWYGDHAKP